ncbi:MAG: serine/threonine-protein phosphatase [Microbacteriaceae bacterium]|jgi:PPM family protein phosphatase|nr:serine/threonine-protein phosphatase [Microbacteriaceae bacterium]
MAPEHVLSAASSHIGKIRASNQDSGSVGRNLFVVADGMGGHAGGDVASALAVKHLFALDSTHGSVEEAREALFRGILDAGATLTNAVEEHPELTGMGTTVSAMIRVKSQMVIAHIGDSRIYRLREGVLEQITVDHTFVQRLVDSGRITPEEAAVHPRRSVLMRVLGDVDADPEIDTHIVDTLPGDRWLLCSDGLSGYVSERDIAETLLTVDDVELAAHKLITQSLSEGAPDNVTVVIVRVAEGLDTSPPAESRMVGAAAGPVTYESGPLMRRPALPALLLHPLRALPPADEHFEPEADYLEELIREDRRRLLRRRVAWSLSVLLVISGLVGAAFAAYEWTQTRYFVGESNGFVAIYQGVPENVGPLSLSTLYEQTDVSLDSLQIFEQERVTSVLPAESLDDAQAIVDRLRR